MFNDANEILVIFSISQSTESDRFDWVHEFNQELIEIAPKRTTMISADMLAHAASCKLNENHQCLIHACQLETDYDLLEMVKNVSQTCACSSMYFLHGLACKLQWFLYNVMKHPAKGGMEQVAL